ncbi:MAG: hypothetical protein L0Y50_03365 [Beijerinckiaceae bacterium]|nr:hypothetical protein [Beijerinckiaceae bacterium]MCI0735304.1 hypothetical protein [Beijerinckiaceae bacterium]
MIDFVALGMTRKPAGTFSAKSSIPSPARVRAFNLATGPDHLGPAGKDTASAALIIDALRAVVPENRIIRADHCFGKVTVQNLIAPRFATTLFKPLWNSADIDHVETTVDESIRAEHRVA